MRTTTKLTSGETFEHAGHRFRFEVERDFAHMQAWCNDEWEWQCVYVVLLKADKDAEGGYFDTIHTASLGGIESDDEGEYLSSVGFELAAEILAELDS